MCSGRSSMSYVPSKQECLAQPHLNQRLLPVLPARRQLHVLRLLALQHTGDHGGKMTAQEAAVLCQGGLLCSPQPHDCLQHQLRGCCNNDGSWNRCLRITQYRQFEHECYRLAVTVVGCTPWCFSLYGQHRHDICIVTG